MITMAFIGIIMYYLGILQGWLLVFYILGCIATAIKNLANLGMLADWLDL